MVQIRSPHLQFKEKSKIPPSYQFKEKSKLPPSYKFENPPHPVKDDPDQYRLYPELEHYRVTYEPPPRSFQPPQNLSSFVSATCPAFIKEKTAIEEKRELRCIDLRLSQKHSVVTRLQQNRTRVCRGDFPSGILPRSVLNMNLEKFARRESLNYSTTQRRYQGEECSVHYVLPLRIFGKVFPIGPRVWERPRSGWIPRPKYDRAYSAPPYPRQEYFTGGITSALPSPISSHISLLDPTLEPNYECECFIQDQSEFSDAEEQDTERVTLQKYIKSLDAIKDNSNTELLVRHFKTYIPPNYVTQAEIDQLHELLREEHYLKKMGVFIILEKLSSKSELCDMLTTEFFVPLMRIWIDLIREPECLGAVLEPIVGFIQKITTTTNSDKWLDDVYKEMIIEATTAQMTYDGTRAHYCTWMLRVFSDSRCCANILANAALSECMTLPQVKQNYWDEHDKIFLDEDIFLQEEILKIFCNIAQSSSFGRKVLICHGVIDTISRILAYANCPVQYQAALLVGALCEDDTGCDHVTSELTNQRADNATCMRHLGNLFLHSQCLRVKAAAGSAISRMFCTSDKKIANRGLRMAHDVLFSKPKAVKRTERPKTAPSAHPMEKTVNLGIVKDVLYKYVDLCTTKGPFSHPNFFRCRLMALEACNYLLSFPLTKDGKRTFHLELGKVLFSSCGESLFEDLKNIADKHRYVKVLQEKIQKIQMNLINKTNRNERLSELLDIELQDIKNDNSVIRIPKRDFDLAKNELIYCEIAIKALSTVLSQTTDCLNVPMQDNSDLLESMRRYNSQYTMLQDSPYNKYAMSTTLPDKPTRPDKRPKSGASKESNGEVHLKFITKLFTYQIVETLVPWLHCVYPPITQHVIRSLSALFVYSSVRHMTLHCVETPETERWIQPSDVALYFTSTSVTPRHISAHKPSVQLPNSLRSSDNETAETSTEKIIVIPNSVKPEVIVEQCTHHIGHLCSKVLTQKLLICNNNTVSHLAAQLLRDITRTVPRDHLMCMIDENLLEKLTEYIILCNGDETSVFVALDILQTLLIFQPTLGKLYHSDGGLDRLVAKLLSASVTPALKQRVLEVISIFPTDQIWCRLNKVDCQTTCHHMDVWHKVISKWENQDNVSRLLSVE